METQNQNVTKLIRLTPDTLFLVARILCQYQGQKGTEKQIVKLIRSSGGIQGIANRVAANPDLDAYIDTTCFSLTA